jgi:DNA-binding SARP family transcriptional activator
VDFRLLGPVEARTDGRVLSLGGARQRALLAALLLQRGAPVSRDRLIEDLWGERPPDGAVKALQVAMSRLRRALDSTAPRLTATPGGYRLLLEPGELDLERFETAAEQGRRALADGNAERASARLRAALEEWRGPPLADAAFQPFAGLEIARLEAVHLAAMADRIEADLNAGRDGSLVPELEALVGQHPLEERLHGQLMLALYRAGRRGEALEAYRSAVRTLDAELGLAPGPELEHLHRRVLDDDPALQGAPVAEPPAPERPRATATILFTDVVESTRMRSDLGDERADEVRREHDRRIRDALGVHGGREVKTLGDGFLATFESAGAAIACSLDIQRAIDRQARRTPAALAVRIGISAGDVAWEGGDVFGTPVVEAQRLCVAARADEIVVSEAVRLLAVSSPEDAFEEAGELTLRGLDRAVRAWRVRWSRHRTTVVPLATALTTDDVPPLAGRAPELATLTRAWDAAREGRRRAALISGEPGIGKTRLAAELAARALQDGGLVLYGRCDDGPALPAQPFAEALTAYAEACPRDELRLQAGAHAGELQALIPSLAARLPHIAEASPAAPEVERLRTLAAAAAFLEAASQAAPLLLVLDDLHWADELSLLLLQHVLRADAPAALLVLATYRDSEPSRSPLLPGVVAGLARQRELDRIELAPLDEPAVAALLTDAGRDPSLAPRVREITEGNPFFVGEVVQVWTDDDGQVPITPRVRDVVRWRLGRLPAGAGDVLTAAAVVGPEFDVDVVALAAGTPAERVLDALEAAESARLVRPAGVLDRFSFSHALVREAIVDGLPAGRRVRLHARVAEALERVSGSRAVPAADLAAHFDAAAGLVDAGRTLHHAWHAGDEAAERLAFDVATEHYERARRAHARLPDASDEERLDLDLALGRSLRLAGDERARRILFRVAADAERAGDGERMARSLLGEEVGVASNFLSDDLERVALLRRALDLLPERDSATRAQTLASLALNTIESLPYDERRSMADDALAMARRAGDRDAVAAVLNAHLWIVMDPQRRRERLALADELVQIGPVASPYAECDGHRFRCMALIEAGDLRAADAALAAAWASARLPVSRWGLCQWDAARAVLAGRLDHAEQLMQQGAAAAQEAGFSPAVVTAAAAAILWCVRRAQGRLHEFHDAMFAMEHAPSRPAWTYIGTAQVAMARGETGAAADAIGAAFDEGFLDLPRGLHWLATMAGAADVCGWLGDRPHSQRLYELLMPSANVISLWTGPVALSLGGVAQSVGRRHEAEAHFRSAVALCERIDAPAYLAIARIQLGRLLRPHPEARDLLEHARTEAERLGMPGWAMQAQQALNGLAPPAPADGGDRRGTGAA